MNRRLFAAQAVSNARNVIYCLVISLLGLTSSGLAAQNIAGDQDIDLVAVNKDIDHARKRLKRLRNEITGPDLNPTKWSTVSTSKLS